ncbi:MAG: hypothetical protein JW876_06195 [Candidatus Krumholzibacteriota bacterium]|nr:hypothetical protein [Candidatus Krumholzibacteriota bacterium]
MKKVVFIVIAAVVVLVVAGVFYLFSNLDSIVAKAIARGGSEATGTSVRVAGVSLSLGEGRATIEGIGVENPDGFSAGDAFTLGEATIDIDPGSLRGEPIVIDEIRVSAPVIVAEIAANGTNNLDVLRRNAQERFDSSHDGEAGGGDEKRIRIARFVFEKGRIELDASAVGLGTRSVDLPSIELTDVGGADGALPGEIAAILMKALAGNAASAIGSAGVGEKIREKLEGAAPEEAKKLLEKIGG